MERLVRNYKKYRTIMLLSFIEIVSFILFIFNLFISSYQDYVKLNGIFIEENRVSFITDSKILISLRKNKFLYYNGKKKKIKILKVTKNIYKKEKKTYHQILVEIPGIKNDKNLNISMYKNKKSKISLFLDTWKED